REPLAPLDVLRGVAGLARASGLGDRPAAGDAARRGLGHIEEIAGLGRFFGGFCHIGSNRFSGESAPPTMPWRWPNCDGAAGETLGGAEPCDGLNVHPGGGSRVSRAAPALI